MLSTLSRRELLLGAAGATARGAGVVSRKLPNIVLVLTDDLGWGDLRCYNPESKIVTPNADRLAAQGMRFTDMHSPSAVCTPARYGFLTGRYCWRTPLKSGVLNGYSPCLIEPGRMTIASLLKSRGYYTAGVGKWHLGLGSAEKTDYGAVLRPGPIDRGFDYYFGIPASLDMPPYVYFENDRPVEKPTSGTGGSGNSKDAQGPFWRAGAMAPSFDFHDVLPAFTRKAVQIIRERAEKKNQPFFLYYPMSAPHTPWLPLAAYHARSRAGDYGDFVTEVDDHLGHLMRALDETGASKNTLLVLTSDNGPYWKPKNEVQYGHHANGGWRGMKADIWEAGHRVPFIARMPDRIKPGSITSEIGCLTDVLATTADLVGSRLPRDAGEDSYSMLPVLDGKRLSGPIREAVVLHSVSGMFSIRQGKWKLCFGLGSGGFSLPRTVEPKTGGPAGQLYNLEHDRAEKENVYLQHPEIVARLTALLEKYQKQGYSRPM